MRFWGTSITFLCAITVHAAWTPHVCEEVPLSASGRAASAAAAQNIAFVTWADSNDGFYDGFGSRVSFDGTRIHSPPIGFSPSPISWQNGNSALKVASDGRNFLIARLDGWRPFTWYFKSRNALLGQSVEIPTPLPAVSGIGLAGGRSGYAAAWTVDLGSPYPGGRHSYVIAVIRLDKQGNAHTTNATIINPEETYTFSSQVAECRGRFLVLWQNTSAIRALVLNDSGLPGPITTIPTAVVGGGYAWPSVAANKNSFATAWYGPLGLHVAQFNLSGDLLGTNHLAVNGVVVPTIVSTLEGWLVVLMTESQTTNAAVRGLPLDQQLQQIAEPFLIDNQVGKYGSATAVATRSREVLVFVERNNNYTDSQLVTRRITFERVR
jgi:hypothetical protein